MAAQVSTITISSVAYSAYAFASDAVQSATDYFGGKLDADAWTNATTANKQKALISAARYMDRHVLWAGTKTVSSQALEFPRNGLTDADGNALANNTIPDDIVEGEFELAIAMLQDSALQSAQSSGSNLRKVQAGSASVEYFRPTAGTAYDAPFPVIVWDLVKPYAAGATALASLSAPTTDGTDEESTFGDTNSTPAFGLDSAFL